MATNTYVALDKVTVANGTTASITFNSINSGYTDLIIVSNGGSVSGFNGLVQFNNDTGANYSWTRLLGTGSAASSDRGTSSNGINFLVYDYPAHIVQIQNYSNTTTYKTALVRFNNPSNYVGGVVGTWRNTAAITSLTITTPGGGTYFPNGMTFSLYGIRAEGTSPTPKATGGAIYSDSTYFYHVFGATGTFTPTQSITADILVVAGGGGSNANSGSGGGAGGLLAFTSQSLTATGYTCTVGAGGNGLNDSAQSDNRGSDSQFGALTLVKGGGGGIGRNYSAGTYINGGSGAGATSGGGNQNVVGTATSGQGNNGGTATNSASAYGSGGGGGAGGVGGNGTSSAGGTGGVGSSTYSSWGVVTGVGQNVSGTYYLAGGGAGGGQSGTAGVSGGSGGGGSSVSSGVGIAGTANTGGGGGAGITTGGNGGSGVIIVRYAK